MKSIGKKGRLNRIYFVYWRLHSMGGNYKPVMEFVPPGYIFDLFAEIDDCYATKWEDILVYIPTSYIDILDDEETVSVDYLTGIDYEIGYGCCRPDEGDFSFWLDSNEGKDCGVKILLEEANVKVSKVYETYSNIYLLYTEDNRFIFYKKNHAYESENVSALVTLKYYHISDDFMDIYVSSPFLRKVRIKLGELFSLKLLAKGPSSDIVSVNVSVDDDIKHIILRLPNGIREKFSYLEGDLRDLKSFKIFLKENQY